MIPTAMAPMPSGAWATSFRAITPSLMVEHGCRRRRAARGEVSQIDRNGVLRCILVRLPPGDAGRSVGDAAPVRQQGRWPDMIDFSPLTKHYVTTICSWAVVPAQLRFKLAAFMAMSWCWRLCAPLDPVVNQDAIPITFLWRCHRHEVALPAWSCYRARGNAFMFADLRCRRCANAIVGGEGVKAICRR